MAGVIQYAKDMIRSRKRSDQTDEGVQFSSLSFEEKLSTLYQEYRCENRNGRLALNRAWFASSLYYQGKQRISWDAESGSFQWFDRDPGEDFYVENQYRKDANANVATLVRNEMKGEPRPSSAKPEDVAAASKASSALHVIEDDIAEKRLKVRKALYLCIYGNAFRYNGFEYDPKNGTETIPKFKYEDAELAGSAICPECGNTAELPMGESRMACPECGEDMEVISQGEIVPTKVEDGAEERTKGRNFSFITGPLEMYARSKCSDISQQPYLFWVRRLDTDIIKHYRPDADTGMGAKGSMGGNDTDLSQYYIDVLSTLAGGPIEGTYESTGERYFREAEYAMCWVRPEAFKGDRELLRKFPEGVEYETCNGTYIKGSAKKRSMDDCWTHYVYLLNPYSFWGDGMYDAMPMQDQINETGSLMVRHMRFSTVGKNIYDQDVITPQWLSNNPDEAWIPANRQLDKSLRESVHQISPTPLSADVGQWFLNQHQSMRDMTKAYDPFQRGANTPYSADVFQAEQASGQFLSTIEYNQHSQISSIYQMLRLFRDNVTEERSDKFRDNTGRWSYDKFSGADLAQGSFDIYIADNEVVPRSKAEKVRGLELFSNIAPLLPSLSQKQQIYIMDVCGLPPEANPNTLVSQKAYRDIETIVKQGQDVIPNFLVLGEGLPIYIKTIREFLMDEDGDDLAAENPDGFVKVHDLMATAMQMAQMMVAGMPPVSGQPQEGQPKQRGTPEKPPQAEMAQAPVPENQKVPMPPLPSGAREGA